MTTNQTSFQAIGTKWDIQVDSVPSPVSWSDLVHKLHRRIEDFDKYYSRFRADSLVTRMSKKAGRYELPADGYKLLSFYHQLYKATDGRVTPLIGQTMIDAGYDAAYSFKKNNLHRPPSWETTLSYNHQSILLKQPVTLDFGAAGKGYLVDILSEMLEDAGIASYTINAGGDIRQRSVQRTALDVGLENPYDPSEAIGIASLSNQSLGASSGSKRKWHGFHHIINPISLQSPTQIIATWVVAGDTLTADGLATALFFSDTELLRSHFSFSYAVLNKDMSLSRSNNFPVTIFEAANVV